MGRRKATELGRFNALCREHGVTYGQGVAMGLKLPEKRRRSDPISIEPAKEVRFDCDLFAKLYNAGLSWSEMAPSFGAHKGTVSDWAQRMYLDCNVAHGGVAHGGKVRVHNQKVTPEEIRKRALEARLIWHGERRIRKYESRTLDCSAFADAYNKGLSGNKIGKALGVSSATAVRWIDRLGLPSNTAPGGKRVADNPKVTAAQVYERAKKAGIKTVEGPLNG